MLGVFPIGDPIPYVPEEEVGSWKRFQLMLQSAGLSAAWRHRLPHAHLKAIMLPARLQSAVPVLKHCS